MALVVFLWGVNIGGRRAFRPSKLREQLPHLDVVSIGAAGTFVVRQPTGRTALRTEIAARLYRRHPEAVRYLGRVDRLFGTPVTTRNWNTIRDCERAGRHAGVIGVIEGAAPPLQSPRGTCACEVLTHQAR
ncbi:MAG: hypothetical protein IT184_09055 [Acidobacteria bacterium]|nr:hypothetical protein [Acidobacteriota bacterium]